MANCTYHFQYQMSLPVDAIKIMLKTGDLLKLNDAYVLCHPLIKHWGIKKGHGITERA